MMNGGRMNGRLVVVALGLSAALAMAACGGTSNAASGSGGGSS